MSYIGGSDYMKILGMQPGVNLTDWYEKLWKPLQYKYEPPMEEDLRLLTSARAEIVRLRRDNELMKARLDMFDAIVAMRNPSPIYYQASANAGFPVDLVDQLDTFINARTITDKVLKDNGEALEDPATTGGFIDQHGHKHTRIR